MAGGQGEDRGWGGWVASLTQWAWVWASSRRWWRTGKSGVLQSMGSQRAGHNWVTKQEQQLEQDASESSIWVLCLSPLSNTLLTMRFLSVAGGNGHYSHPMWFAGMGPLWFCCLILYPASISYFKGRCRSVLNCMHLKVHALQISMLYRILPSGILTCEF